jgi:hypothetical protein
MVGEPADGSRRSVGPLAAIVLGRRWGWLEAVVVDVVQV